MTRFLPAIVVVLGAAWFASAFGGPKTAPGAAAVHEFGKIPVVHNGRVKPIDSLARTTLRVLAERESVKDGEVTRPAVEWLLAVIAEGADREKRAVKLKVFRITHPQLLHQLGLEERPGSFRYSIDEFGGRVDTLADQVKSAHERQEGGVLLDSYEKAILKFWEHLIQYRQLADHKIPHAIPPSGGHDWRRFGEIGEDDGKTYLEAWREMLISYGEGDAARFNAAVSAYLERLRGDRPADARKAQAESWFSHLDTFTKCQWLYFGGFILAVVALMMERGTAVNRAGWYLIFFSFVMHTVSLIIRIYLSGRPPVTNLYSSAIFIGWGCVGLGLVLEKLFKIGVGNLVAAASGFMTLQVAAALAADGDTMEVLQAVLDTQFWLATHVTCITLGYSTTYLAGLIGIVFILRGVFTSSVTPDLAAKMTRMTYGVTCFAMFFSFVGTVLGGLWADDSWGRFWGWDPKENGALMIVLWNALILHARWGGLVRERGLALLAVAGNIVVSWSWFGVNLMGEGLHAYGFTEGRTFWLVLFCVSQAVVIGLGLMPAEWWKSGLPVRGANAKDR